MNGNILSILSILAPIVGEVLPSILNKNDLADDCVDAVKSIGKKVGLDLTTKQASAAILIAEELVVAAADGKITVTEAFNLIDTLCAELGVDFDKTGVQFN